MYFGEFRRNICAQDLRVCNLLWLARLGDYLNSHLKHRVQCFGLILAGDVNIIFTTPSVLRLCCQVSLINVGRVWAAKRRVIGVTGDQRARSD